MRMYICGVEIRESLGRNTRTFLPLCPSLSLSLFSSCGKLKTGRGGWKHLDHDLSSGALRQIKARHLMRGDWGDLPSCSKSSLGASTLSSHCTWSRLHCPAIFNNKLGACSASHYFSPTDHVDYWDHNWIIIFCDVFYKEKKKAQPKLFTKLKAQETNT